MVTGQHAAITVTGRQSGAITLSGAGAGGDATACSVVADLLAAQDWLATEIDRPRCEVLV
jgi:homoserine dehydrogenase